MMANGIRAWQQRGRLTALASIGWMIMAGSGYLTWLNWEGKDQQLLLFSYIGLGLAALLIFLFSSSRQLRQGKDIACGCWIV